MNDANLTKPGSVDAQVLIEILVATCCEDLFSDHGHALAWSDSREPPEGVSFCSIVGFAGTSLRGSLVLGISSAAMDTLGYSGDPLARDLIGELSNQLLGRLKNKLLTYQVEISLTIPVVLRGQQFCPMLKTTLTPICFRLGQGLVWAWVEVECSNGFEMRLAPDATLAPVTEGETLLF